MSFFSFFFSFFTIFLIPYYARLFDRRIAFMPCTIFNVFSLAPSLNGLLSIRLCLLYIAEDLDLIRDTRYIHTSFFFF